ncbi:MAG: hypothetical protein ACTSU3_01300 [Candidatus Thorarchaeota archaeon]
MSTAFDEHLSKKNGLVPDRKVLRDVLKGSLGRERSILQPDVFEKEFKLKAIPKKCLPIEKIVSTLSGGVSTKLKLREINRWGQLSSIIPHRPVHSALHHLFKNTPYGARFDDLAITFQDHIQNAAQEPHYFTKNLEELIEEFADDKVPLVADPTVFKRMDKASVNAFINELELRESLIYTINHILIGDIPRRISWMLSAPGLNYLTHSLMSLYLLSINLKDPIKWIEKIVDPSVVTLPMWGTTPLVPSSDGILAEQWNDTIEKVRADICVLRFGMIQEICKKLSKSKSSHLLAQSEAASLLRSAKGKFRRDMRYLDFVITERFNPVVNRIGLQYRILLIPKHKDSVKSDGIVEQIKVNKSMFTEYEDITIHVEPTNTSGPSRFSRSGISFVSEKETVSFRMDLFDDSTQDWIFTPWKKPQKRTPKRKGWLYWESLPPSDNKIKIDPTEIPFVSLLWSNQSSHSTRRELIDLLIDSESLESKRKDLRKGAKAEKYIERERIKRKTDSYLKNGLFEIMYHPALQYSAIPESAIFSIHDESPNIISEVSNWVMGSFPFSRVFSNKRNMIAFARVPIVRGNFTISYAKEKFEEMEINHHVGVVEEMDRFALTMPSKLFDIKSKKWKDPW